MPPLGELGEDGEDGLEVFIETVTIGTVKRPEPEIVENREFRKNLPPLRDEGNPQPDAVWR